MIIERLDLTAFGRFTNVSLDLSAGPNRFHIVYGPNESGKSTSLRAITSLLYGMPARTTDNFLHPNGKMRVGGRLTNESGEVIECVRRRGRKDTLRDADDQQSIDESILKRLLAGVDQEVFQQRFGLSHDELVRGGAEVVAGGGDLGSILFAASTGVTQLRLIQTELEKRQSTLYIPKGKNGSINQAVTKLAQQKKDLRDAQVMPADFEERTNQLSQKKSEATRLTNLIKAKTKELTHFQSLKQALPLSASYKNTQAKLKLLLSVPLLDDGFTERRRSIETEREVATRKRTELQKRRAQLADELTQYPERPVTVANESSIQHLYQKLGAREEALRDRADLIRKRDNMNRRMIELLGDLQVGVVAQDDSDISEAIDHSVEKLRIGEAAQTRVHELARTHEKLVQQRDDSSEELVGLTQRIETLQNELESFDVAIDPEPTNQLIDTVVHPDLLLDSVSKRAADVERARRACEQVRRRLTGVEMSNGQLATLVLPATMSIQDAASAMERANQAVSVKQVAKDDAVAKRVELVRHVNTTVSVQPLPTEAELSEARQERDRSLASLLDGNDDEVNAATVQRAIEKADRLVDTIRANHEQVHRRAQEAARLEALDAEIELCNEELSALIEVAESAQLQWAALWQSKGVVADTPSRMQQWVSDHEQFVTCYDQLNEQKSRLQEAQHAIQLTCHRLKSAIGNASPVAAGHSVESNTSDTLFAQEDSQTDLRQLYDEAIVARRRLNDEKNQREKLQLRLGELKQELPVVQSRYQSRQRQVEKWNEEWAVATSALTQNHDATPTVVTKMMSQVQSLAAQKRERDILSKRIQTIQSESEAYRLEVKQLAISVGLAVGDNDDEHAFMRELFQRLCDDRAAMGKRDSVEQSLQECELALAELSDAHTKCEVVLQQLCAESQCETPAELAETERKSRERRELEKGLAILEEKFQLLQSGKSISSLIEEAECQDISALELELENCERDIDQLCESLAQTQHEIGAIQSEIDAIDGSRDAADLNQSIQMMTGDLARDAEEYARLKIASLILNRSIEHYRRENQGPVLRFAKETFCKLTSGEYHDLRVDHDSSGKLSLFGVTNRDVESTELVPANVMSTGTADSLYLALRLASLRHHLTNNTPIPLIVDDCLVQLDDQRAAAALSVFSELSTQTQIVLFTHHQHLVDLAKSKLEPNKFHAHQLVG